VELATRYITGRFLPDKAIDVIDEAGSRVRMRTMTRPPDLKDLEREIEDLNKEKEEAVAQQDFERAANLRDQADKLKKKKEQIKREWREASTESGGVVDEEVVAETVSKMTGIPLTRLEKAEAERLLMMEAELHNTVISQDEAIKAIARAVRRSRSGLKDPKRPVGSFIFLGPTGVGKTLLAKALAKFMFGEERRWSRSTCPSTWRSTTSPGSSARPPATSASRRAASSRRRSAAGPTRSSCSTRSRRPTWTSSTCCSRSWRRAS
jgi:ATP-dependent Clp protease ATP-binding subunit ClpC